MMRKLIYGILATVIYAMLSSITINLLYHYQIITGILRGPSLGFIAFKIYTSLLLLFCLYKLIVYRSAKEKMKEWLLLSIFAILQFAIAFIYLNL
jgi:hypothetical protein